MSMDRMEGISIVGRGEEVVSGEIDKGDRVGKTELLGGGVCLGNHRLACSVKSGRVVHPGVVMFDERVVGGKGQKDKVMVDVREGELMMYNR